MKASLWKLMRVYIHLGMYSFWHTFVVLCKPTVTHTSDQWQNHSMWLLPCWLGHDSGSSPTIPFGFFLAIFLSIVGLDILAISTASELREGLTPPLTNLDLLSASGEPDWWCHVMQLQPEIRNKKSRHIWAWMCPSLFFPKRTTCKIKPEACFFFISHPDLKAVVPKLLALHWLKPTVMRFDCSFSFSGWSESSLGALILI